MNWKKSAKLKNVKAGFLYALVSKNFLGGRAGRRAASGYKSVIVIAAQKRTMNAMIRVVQGKPSVGRSRRKMMGKMVPPKRERESSQLARRSITHTCRHRQVSKT